MLSSGYLSLPGFIDKITFKTGTGQTFDSDKRIEKISPLDVSADKTQKSSGTGLGKGKNDTAEIQAMINSLPDSGGEVIIPSGIYLIDAVKSIWLKSNMTLTMAPDAILKAIPNNAATYAVLQIADVENVRISGGTILGERKDHLGTSGEWGMGVRITGSKDIFIQNTVVNDCWGDGFYIGTGTAGRHSERISLIDVQADNNRRQGISLISGKDIKIVRPRLTNTYGTPPAAGLDIEPNQVTETLENIEVLDAYTAGNAEGILVVLNKLNGVGTPVSIHIRNHQDEGSGRGLLVSSSDAIVPGILTIEDSVWSNAKKNGLSIQNHDHRSFAIEVIRPRIINANQSGALSAVTGSAIAVYHFNGRNGIIGNVSIFNPLITDSGDGPKAVTAFYIANSQGQEIANLSIIDPVLGGNMVNQHIAEKLRQYIRYTH
jgi:hypothetical protein